MRIYICGAHSTGKTTLARHIAQETGLPLINEVARQVMAETEYTFESLRANLGLVAKYQKEVFRRQLMVEQGHEGGFVSDRAFCNLAYAARHTLILHELLPQATEYVEGLRSGLVFFLRPTPECVADDMMREQSNWDEIIRIDGIIDFLLAMYEIPSVGIAEHSMKSRVRTALAVVGLYARADRS